MDNLSLSALQLDIKLDKHQVFLYRNVLCHSDESASGEKCGRVGKQPHRLPINWKLCSQKGSSSSAGISF
jgi:hypothetical protein